MTTFKLSILNEDGTDKDYGIIISEYSIEEVLANPELIRSELYFLVEAALHNLLYPENNKKNV